MAIPASRRTDLHVASDHYRTIRRTRSSRARLFGWRVAPSEPPVYSLSPYTPEDELLDQLERLPSREQIEDVLGRLAYRDVRPWAVGVVADNVDATRRRDIVGIARTINEWIATA